MGDTPRRRSAQPGQLGRSARRRRRHAAQARSRGRAARQPRPQSRSSAPPVGTAPPYGPVQYPSSMNPLNTLPTLVGQQRGCQQISGVGIYGPQPRPPACPRAADSQRLPASAPLWSGQPATAGQPPPPPPAPPPPPPPTCWGRVASRGSCLARMPTSAAPCPGPPAPPRAKQPSVESTLTKCAPISPPPSPGASLSSPITLLSALVSPLSFLISASASSNKCRPLLPKP